MKDNRLENEFEEYFKGVNISSDITADAKASMAKPKRRIWPQIAKFASIAASIVLVFAVSLTVILKLDFNKASPGNTAGGGNEADAPDTGDTAPGDSSSGAVDFVFYTDSDLEKSDANAHSISKLDSSLKIIENFALASNASVESCKTAYKDDKLALVIAKVNILSGLNRDETTIFVEFTEKNSVYGELADYYETSIRYYRGTEYYLTKTYGENGEPEFRLHISYGGVKYYFSVHSSDERAYEKYLDMVIA